MVTTKTKLKEMKKREKREFWTVTAPIITVYLVSSAGIAITAKPTTGTIAIIAILSAFMLGIQIRKLNEAGKEIEYIKTNKQIK